MSSRLVKWLVLASVLVMAFPVVAMASTARIEGMAIQGDYVKDYTGVYTYLSNMCCTGNIVYGELGNTNSSGNTLDRAVGAFLGNLWEGRYGNWGIHLREETPQLGQGDVSSNVGPGTEGFDPNLNTSHAFDLMWGKKFGSMSLGLRLNRSYARLEGDPTIIGEGTLSNVEGDFFDTFSGFGLNYDRNILGFGAGVGFELNPKTNWEISFLYQNRTYDLKDTTGVEFQDKGAAAYLFATRLMWQWQPNVMVVPVFKYWNFNLDAKETVPAPGTNSSLTSSQSGWQAGLAGNWALSQNDLFVLGATFASNVFKEKDTPATFDDKFTEMNTPQVFAALETHVNPWLTLRFGANQGAFYSLKREETLPGTNTTTAHYSPFSMSLGAGLKLNTLQLDATLNQAFVHNMPYFVSGATTNNLFPKVTATYNF